jgi:hypothetical protein
MSKQPLDREDRLEKQYRRLKTRNPACLGCGESNPFCLELHHLAGQKNHGDVSIVCRNCHRKLSDEQHNHAVQSASAPEGMLGTIGHYLLGLADFLSMIVHALREFGRQLIGQTHAAE